MSFKIVDYKTLVKTVEGLRIFLQTVFGSEDKLKVGVSYIEERVEVVIKEANQSATVDSEIESLKLRQKEI